MGILVASDCGRLSAMFAATRIAIGEAPMRD
jgi:hypothetical protein